MATRAPSNEASPPSPDLEKDVDRKDAGFVVGWEGKSDPGDPLNTPHKRRWVMTWVLGVACACVTCCSSMASATYPGMEADYGVGREVCTLSISLFVAGLGVGPLFLGPASEFIGRSRVLHLSFAVFWLFNLPVAFANNIAVHLIFRFFTGFAGSAFLSVSGGAVSDVFPNHLVGTPMMVWSAAPFIGPTLGPLVSGFINQNMSWRWAYYVIIIWAAIMMALLLLFVPETYSPELLRRRASRMRKETGDTRWVAPVEMTERHIGQALLKSCKTPFILLTTQMMVLFLDIWSALVLGILYLSFGGLPYIFQTQYGFTVEQSGLCFLGIGLGQVLAVLSQPLFHRHYRQIAARSPDGIAPPESRLIPGFFGVIACPLGLLLLGLLSFENVPWILPILGSLFFGVGMVYSFTSTFTYLVDAYRPVAASALASNSFLRSAFAAGFPLFGHQLYVRLGAIGGTCLLAGLMALTIPLPFVFYRIGARIRQRSPFSP
ncbi:hypothetical protein EHS25_004083 [Saitozyma podzolica]|uniref:Major facilitator superfamily (MFS) profile domain-containing protein n=1 Tax=Saitozyma podzolica TaxID=1890683 RepID=A0A427YT35_9TREE|nr:hypothetical protein EHS25_004083 [Saitozyma podzolica]